MPAFEVVALLTTFINVVIGLWFLPSAINLDSRGRFKSVALLKFSTYAVVLIFLNSLAVLQGAAWSIDSFGKIMLLSLLPFIAAYLMKQFYFANLSA